MTSAKRQRVTARARQPWGPTWARVLAGVALAPAAVSLVLGIGFFAQGFGDDALSAVGWFVGAILMLFAVAITVPTIWFLARRGKAPFIVAMCSVGLLLGVVTFFGF